VVHGAVEAVGAGADGGVRHGGDERVARARADALAHPIGEPDHEHVPGSQGEGDERPDGGGDPVAGEHERLQPRAPIGCEAGRVLEDVRDELGRALDEADEGVGGAERREERREEREDRLARGVGEQAHEPEGDDRARQLQGSAIPAAVEPGRHLRACAQAKS
jgi:hypothetical protein